MSMTTHGSRAARWVAGVVLLIIATGLWAGYRHLYPGPKPPPPTGRLYQRVLSAEPQAIDNLAHNIHTLYQRKWYKNWPEHLYGPPRDVEAIRKSLSLVKPDAHPDWYASLPNIDAEKSVGARGDVLALFRYSINDSPADDRLIVAIYAERANIWTSALVLSANALDYPDYEQAMASGKVIKYTVGGSR